MTDNQREAGTIILDPTHVSFSQQEGVNDLGATHFIGIGGAGMSVLARCCTSRALRWMAQIVSQRQNRSFAGAWYCRRIRAARGKCQR